MRITRFKVFLLVFIGLQPLAVTPVQAQEVFLHEFDLSKGLWGREHWGLQATANWKHIYNKIGWSRVGVSPVLDYTTGPWTFQGGVGSSFTFDSQIDNFWEVRPWIALNFRFTLLRKILVEQRFRSEWREFYTYGDFKPENYHRFRYGLGLVFRLWDNPRWSQRLGFEWYILDSPAAYERFPNERDYNLTFIHVLPNNHQITFGFELESYLNSQLRADGHAYLLILGFRI